MSIILLLSIRGSSQTSIRYIIIYYFKYYINLYYIVLVYYIYPNIISIYIYPRFLTDLYSDKYLTWVGGLDLVWSDSRWNLDLTFRTLSEKKNLGWEQGFRPTAEILTIAITQPRPSHSNVDILERCWYIVGYVLLLLLLLLNSWQWEFL